MFHAKKGSRKIENIGGLDCKVPLPPKNPALIRGSHLPKKQQQWYREGLPQVTAREVEFFTEDAMDLAPDSIIDWDVARRQEIIKQTGFDPWDKSDKPVPGVIPNINYVNPTLHAFRVREFERCYPWTHDDDGKEVNNGIWFMNNGTPVYLTPFHYFYMEWWCLNTGYPYYRDTDRQKFYYWQYCFEDPVCYGYMEADKRGGGKTYRATSVLYQRSIYGRDTHSGIQSKTDDDALELFNEKLVKPYQKLPDFWRPINKSGTTPSGKIEFMVKSNRTKSAMFQMTEQKLALNTLVDFRSSSEVAYDGANVTGIMLRDEEGKCLSISELVKIYGEVNNKRADQIRVGDILINQDGHPTKVLKTIKGTQQMYRVIPKKGESWECNENHTLILKVSSDLTKELKKDDTVKYTVKEYLRLPERTKKHLMLYRAKVEYPKRQFLVSPYLLGLWLGDGSQSCLHIHTPDQEVIDYLRFDCESIGAELTIKEREGVNCYSMQFTGNELTKTGKYSTEYHKYFNNQGLFKEKHIPEEYLLSSREDRLELLAGLIDSDGYKQPGKNAYEIIQKRKKLSLQIKELCFSLGFYCSITEKEAKVKEKSYGAVYRMRIFGDDLSVIPCEVERKKCPSIKVKHKNTKTVSRTGFNVVPIGEGEYAGFEVDGDHTFLLHDYTVIHNCEPRVCDVAARHEVTKASVFRDDRIFGKIYSTTTVEEMEKGGANYEQIFMDSDPLQRNDIGETKSGLYRLFMPAYMTSKFDEYGMPIIDDPAPNQRIKNQTTGKIITKGARTEQAARRKQYKNEPKKYLRYCLKFPWTIEELFYTTGEGCPFNVMVLEECEMHYKMHGAGTLDQMTDPGWLEKPVFGNFEWKDGIPFSEAIFVPEVESNAKWCVSYLFPSYDNRANKVKKDTYINKEYFSPLNKNEFFGGFDPTKSHKSVDKRRSKAGGSIYRKQQFWEKEVMGVHGTWVADFLWEPDDPLMQYDYFLIGLWYYGAQVLLENNIPTMLDRYGQLGCYDPVSPDEHFIIWRWSEISTNKEQFTPGLPSNDPVNNQLLQITQNHIHHEGRKLLLPRMVKDFKAYREATRTKHDLSVAGQLSLMASTRPVKKAPEKVELQSLFRRY